MGAVGGGRLHLIRGHFFELKVNVLDCVCCRPDMCDRCVCVSEERDRAMNLYAQSAQCGDAVFVCVCSSSLWFV